MEKVSIIFEQESGWKSYSLICEKKGEEKDGYLILHPLDSDNFNSLRINNESDTVIALTDKGEKEYQLNFVKNWESVHEIQIFGSSDDLIEIRGDTTKEFYANYDEPTYININNTTVVRVEYNRSAEWEVEMIDNGNCENYTHYGVNTETSNNYKSYSELLCVGFNNPIHSVEKTGK